MGFGENKKSGEYNDAAKNDDAAKMTMSPQTPLSAFDPPPQAPRSTRLGGFLRWRAEAPWGRDLAIAAALAAVGVGLRWSVMGFDLRLAHMTLLPLVAAAAVVGRPRLGLAVVLVTGLFIDGRLIASGQASGCFGFAAYAALGIFMILVCDRLLRAFAEADADRRRVAAWRAFHAGLVQSSNDPIVTKSLDGCITGWNAAAERLFGYAPTEALGRPITLLVPPDRFAEETEIVARVRRGEIVDQLVTQRITKDGRLLDVMVTVSPVRDERGAIVGASKVLRDLTQQNQTAAALRSSEEWLRCALEGANAGAWSWDCVTMTSEWSPRFFEMHGLAPGSRQPSLLLWLESIYSQDRIAAQRSLNQTLRGETRDYQSQYRIRTEDGDTRWIELFGRAERGPDGVAQRLAGIAIDVTERRRAVAAVERANEELRRANESLKRFSSVAAHDLQEPLRKIEQFGDLLGKEFASALADDGAFYVKVMRQSARRMRALINDLLAFSRAGHRPLQTAAIDANAVAQQALAACATAIEEAGAEVELGPLPPLVGDSGLVRALFQNLVSNAVKYRRPEAAPHIAIAARFEDDAIVYDFVDDGVGIAPEHQSVIFEPFTRLDPHEATKGTGIGLAFCRTVCERHGWRLTVTSQPGAGSTFSVIVPASASSQQHAA
jgi:PAS domain S-box-containing protein